MKRAMTKDQLAGHVAFFGCDDKQGLGDAVITWEDDGHSGAGWYIHCDEYPEEGSAFLDGNHKPFPELLKLLQEQAVRDRHMVPVPTPDGAVSAAKCESCRGRGWHVGECHPREVCPTCDGTGTVACCPSAKSVETPTQYVWRCEVHSPEPPATPRTPT